MGEAAWEARQAGTQALLQEQWEPWKVLEQLMVAVVTLAAEGQVGSGMWGGVKLLATGGNREGSGDLQGTPKVQGGPTWHRWLERRCWRWPLSWECGYR